MLMKLKWLLSSSLEPGKERFHENTINGPIPEEKQIESTRAQQTFWFQRRTWQRKSPRELNWLTQEWIMQTINTKNVNLLHWSASQTPTSCSDELNASESHLLMNLWLQQLDPASAAVHRLLMTGDKLQTATDPVQAASSGGNPRDDCRVELDLKTIGLSFITFDWSISSVIQLMIIKFSLQLIDKLK